MIKIYMDSGQVLELKHTNYTKFKSLISNSSYMLFSFPVEIEEYIIVPSHISSIEID